MITAFNFVCWSFWPHLAPPSQERVSVVIEPVLTQFLNLISRFGGPGPILFARVSNGLVRSSEPLEGNAWHVNTTSY